MPSFAHTAYVATTGNDSTAQLDSQTLKFATAQAAYDAVFTAWSGDTENNYLLQFAAGTAVQYGGINVTAGDWPANIWIQGAGKETTAINGVVGANGADSSYYEVAGGINLTINSDGSINLKTIIAGNGGNFTDEGDGYYGHAGTGGAISLTGVYFSLSATAGNGGNSQFDMSSGGEMDAGNGGDASIVNCGSTSSATISSGSGGSVNSPYILCASGSGGTCSIDGELYQNALAGVNVFSGNAGSVSNDGYSGNGGTVSIQNIYSFDSCTSGSGGNIYLYAGGGSGGSVNIQNVNSFVNAYSGVGGTSGFGSGGSGGSITIQNVNLFNSAVAGGGAYGDQGSGGSGGSITISSCNSFSSCSAGSGNQGVQGGGGGGSCTISSSNCTGWIYAGSGGHTDNSTIQGSAGGNIILTNSTFPNGLYGGIAGECLGSDYYINGTTGFGTVQVDGGTATFSYPATDAVAYVPNLNTSVWDVYANWLDSNGNYASNLPNASSNVNLYSTVLYTSGFGSGPVSVNQISFHNGAQCSFSFFECNSATFRDSSSIVITPQEFFVIPEINFWDNSSITYASGPITLSTICETANFYSGGPINNIINSVISGYSSGTITAPGSIFTTTNVASSSSSSGNSMISRLLNFPWFINF